eukprot:scaffold4633_cov155-Ochromonas_danica.AAC.1
MILRTGRMILQRIRGIWRRRNPSRALGDLPPPSSRHTPPAPDPTSSVGRRGEQGSTRGQPVQARWPQATAGTGRYPWTATTTEE